MSNFIFRISIVVGFDQSQSVIEWTWAFVLGEPLPEATNKTTNAAGLTPDQVKHIKMMIAKAGSLEEIERLNMMLRNGQMPGMETPQTGEEMEQ